MSLDGIINPYPTFNWLFQWRRAREKVHERGDVHVRIS